MLSEISVCRICGNTHLVSLLDLGQQALTGVFPKSKSEKITSGPLEIVKCISKNGKEDICGLVQLKHAFSNEEMYGMNYGYRSGLNQGMVRHLHSIVEEVMKIAKLEKDDLIIDIGSNDSTLLSKYPANIYQLTGIDPTGTKFKKYYPAHIRLIPEFFSAKTVQKHFPSQKAKVISSIAMFYDLEKPLDFVKDVYEILHDEGIWVFEQSYLLLMIQANAYDTVCHEHAEYYALEQIKWMMDKVGFKILDVDLNDTNGGSFRVTVAKKNSSHTANQKKINELLENEKKTGLNNLTCYQQFAQEVVHHKEQLCKLVNEINQSGKKIFGYGASTKGNVVLQYCGFTEKDIPFIAEVNEDKFGSFTPGTHIPIISEKEARNKKPDYFLVLPWHFKEGIVQREKDYLKSGGKLIFPLPKIQIIGE